MSVAGCFAASYREARERFLATADRAGAEVTSYEHPELKGPVGETLAIDVAAFGVANTDRALIVISGTHGVEGFCGSGCQVALLEDGFVQARPPNCALVLLHALNPYGFAWLRRVNEDGVDVNRNFQDFDRPLPDSSAYEALHEALVPAEWEGVLRADADRRLAGYVGRHGLRAFQAALSTGQYTRPAGLFYGGRERTWSARTLAQVLTTRLPARLARLAVLDLHTGLGPHGYGEPIALGTAADCARAREWYGPDVKTLSGDESVSAAVVGSLPAGVAESTPGVETTYVALEFGTVPMAEVITALRGDHWLHAYGDLRSPTGESIKRRLREAFYVDTPAWKAAVYGRTADFVLRAYRALAHG